MPSSRCHSTVHALVVPGPRKRDRWQMAWSSTSSWSCHHSSCPGPKCGARRFYYGHHHGDGLYGEFSTGSRPTRLRRRQDARAASRSCASQLPPPWLPAAKQPAAAPPPRLDRCEKRSVWSCGAGEWLVRCGAGKRCGARHVSWREGDQVRVVDR